GLHDEVVAGEGGPLCRPETTDGRVDDPGIPLLDCVIIQAEALETTRLKILDKDISAGSEFVGQSQICGIIEVENDRALVAIDGQVIGCHAIAIWWHPGTGVIPCRTLDLNYRCSEIPKKHGAV